MKMGMRTDRKGELDEDKAELNPERQTQDAVLAVVDTQTLIFSADENGGNDVSSTGTRVSVLMQQLKLHTEKKDLHEDNKQNIVRIGVMARIENGQEDQSASTNYGKDNRANGQGDLLLRGVVRQTTLVSEPALGNECHVENHHCDGRASNEERLHS